MVLTSIRHRILPPGISGGIFRRQVIQTDGATIYVNEKPFPSPKRGLAFLVTTIVSTTRNALGEFIGQKVGRDQHKLNNLEWPVLDAATWASMLQEFDSSFVVTVRYPDMVKNQWTTRLMYPGDRSAEPYEVDEEGFPTKYINCKVNLIDCGVIE